MYVCVGMYVWVCMYVFMYLCIYVCVIHAHIHTRIHTHIHTVHRPEMPIHSGSEWNTRIYIHASIHTHIKTHTHTHTLIQYTVPKCRYTVAANETLVDIASKFQTSWLQLWDINKVCMYLCMYVCIYICIYVCMYVFMYRHRKENCGALNRIPNNWGPKKTAFNGFLLTVCYCKAVTVCYCKTVTVCYCKTVTVCYCKTVENKETDRQLILKVVSTWFRKKKELVG
jgi:hypothetical protein